MKINVLGTEYDIFERTRDENAVLQTCDGYCDKTVKKICVLSVNGMESDLEKPEWFMKKVKRHEIVHAFLLESGLHENVEWNEELIVDWIAVQGEKIYKAWREAKCL